MTAQTTEKPLASSLKMCLSLSPLFVFALSLKPDESQPHSGCSLSRVRSIRAASKINSFLMVSPVSPQQICRVMAFHPLPSIVRQYNLSQGEKVVPGPLL